MSVQGKVIVLTGASRGMGLAIAHYLLKKQCRLVVVSRSAEPLMQLQGDYPDQVKVVAGDLADFTLAKKAISTATDTWKQLDGLIANHGTLEPVKRVADLDAEEWRSAFDINVFSIVALIKASLPALRKSKGRIILTSSGAAANAYTGWAAYGAAKATLNHLASSLAEEEPEVTTIALRPGVVDTEMQRDIREKHKTIMSEKDSRKFSELKSTGKLLKPEQPGHVIAKLALNAPSELSGRFINWDDEVLKDFQG